MAARRRRQLDLNGIRQRGATYQVRVFAGNDPVTGKKLYLSGNAANEAAAVRLRDDLRRQVDDAKAARTSVTVGYLLDEWMSTHRVELKTRQSYELLITKFIKPTLGEISLPKLLRLGPQPLERLYAELLRCRRRCGGTPYVEHHVKCGRGAGGDCNSRCRPHECRPLAVSSVRQIHAVLSGAFSAAVRWGWIGVNPMEAVVQPRAQLPRPNPPSSEEASRIVAAAWEQDEDWGTFVWLTFVTGARRGELIALQWADFDANTGVLAIQRSVVRGDSQLIVKDTKTNQMRRIALDETTTELLANHRQRYEDRGKAAGMEPYVNAYIFSYEPDSSRPCDPDAISHRYTKMAAKLNIRTHLHALRHYSATKLLAAGVDLRTVAGRLGHGGGGATTLKVYAAWRPGADRAAAAILASQLAVVQRPRKNMEERTQT